MVPRGNKKSGHGTHTESAPPDGADSPEVRSRLPRAWLLVCNSITGGIDTETAWSAERLVSAASSFQRGGEITLDVRDLKLHVVSKRDVEHRITDVNTGVVYATLTGGRDSLRIALLFAAAPDLLHVAEWFPQLVEELERRNLIQQLGEPNSVRALYHEAQRVLQQKL